MGPHGEAEDNEYEDEQREREREPQACELSRTLALDTETPLRSVEAVRPLDGVTPRPAAAIPAPRRRNRPPRPVVRALPRGGSLVRKQYLSRVSPMVLPSPEELTDSRAVPSGALRALVDAVHTADFGSSHDALEAFASVTVEICAAEAAVVRLVDPDGTGLTAHAVHATSPSLAAELAGSARGERGRVVVAARVRIQRIDRVDGDSPARSRFCAGRRRSPRASDSSCSSLPERSHSPACARLTTGRDRIRPWSAALVLAGKVLAAGGSRTQRQKIAVSRRMPRERRRLSSGDDDGEPTLAASFGESAAAESAALSAARVALDSRSFLIRERHGRRSVVSVRLGEPAVGVLQVVFRARSERRSPYGLTNLRVASGADAAGRRFRA